MGIVEIISKGPLEILWKGAAVSGNKCL